MLGGWVGWAGRDPDPWLEEGSSMAKIGPQVPKPQPSRKPCRCTLETLLLRDTGTNKETAC
jgi:hypothetical protein